MSNSTVKSLGVICVGFIVSAHFGCFSRQCWLNESTLPPLLGFRLGMSGEELKQRFRGLQIKDLPYTELFFSGSVTLPREQDVSSRDEIGHVAVNTSRFPEFAEVSAVELKLENGHVSLIEVTYPDSSRWQREDDFLIFVAQTLHLPDRRYWKSEQQARAGDGASITCNGLRVRAGFHLIIGSAPAPGGPAPIAFPFVVVEDDNARQKLRR